MFYLSKICRICVRNSENLLDIDSDDYDLIKISEKLKLCTKMVIHKEDLLTSICMSCIKKLRISYVFQKMCAHSDIILQNYVKELMSAQQQQINKNEDNKPNKFSNSDLRVTVSPLPCVVVNCHYTPEVSEVRPRLRVTNIEKLKTKYRYGKVKRQRVSKGQRCSLLKKLLSNYHQQQSNNLLKDKVVSRKSKNHRSRKLHQQQKKKGGLRDLLGFVKSYDFGYKINEPVLCKDDSALGRLEQFSKTFFYTDFSNYHDTILSVIHESESDDDDNMFDTFNEEEDINLWHNEFSNNNTVIIKQEPPSAEITIKSENEEEEVEEFSEDILPFEFVQACYEQELPANSSVPIKTEKECDTISNNKEKGKKKMRRHENFNNNHRVESMMTSRDLVEPSCLELLEQFATSKGKSSATRTMSPLSLKCRTRGHPFINPQLMEQFKKRSFKCDTCNRCFKSPGYLHSHCTKMGH